MADTKNFTVSEIDRIIEMAWEDRTTFEAIKEQFGINQDQVIRIMRSNLKPSSFKLWRKRTTGQTTKHAKLRPEGIDTFKSRMQKTIARNKISKKNDK
jgi:uncharacterized protein (TIGR03643 family)